MALPNYAELIFEQGKTFKWWFRVEYPDAPGVAVDLPAEGYTIARLFVRPDYDQAPVVTLTTANGGIVLGSPPIDDGGGQLWTGYLYMAASGTAALTEWGIGRFDMEAENGFGDVIPVLVGPACLQREVSY